jgi:hypothetical protein
MGQALGDVLKSPIAKQDLLLFLMFVILLALLFQDFFFTDSAFFERDSHLVEIPMRKHSVELLREGNFALWTDSHGNGQPFLANPKHAVCYPTTWLYLLLPFFWAFKLHYLLHFILIWLGLFCLSRGYGFSRPAAFMTGSIFVFSGMLLSSVEFYNHIAALAWMPWILLVLVRPQGAFLGNGIKLALLWALLILAGAPYVIVITMILGGIQIIFHSKRAGERAALLLVSFCLALLVAAVQLYPTADLAQQSGRDLERQFVWSFQPLQFFNLTFPHIFGNDRQPGRNIFWGYFLFYNRYPLFYSLYLGFGAVLLCLFGLKRPWDWRRWTLVLSICVCVLLALGSNTPLVYLQKILPPFSFIRFPVKYLMGAIFSLALLSGLGFEALLARVDTEKKPIYTPLLGAVALLVIFFVFKKAILKVLEDFFVISSPLAQTELAKGLSHGFLIFLAVSFCLLLFSLFVYKSKRPQFTWLVVGIVVLDLLLINRFINPVLPTDFFSGSEYLRSDGRPLTVYRDEFFPYDLRDRLGSSRNMHRYFRQSHYIFSGVGEGIRYVFNDDFYGLNGDEYNRILEHLETCSKNELIKILASAGCQIHIGPSALPELPTREEEIQGHSVFFQTLPEPLKSPQLIHDVVVAPTLQEKMSVFGRPDFNPGKTVIVEKALLFEKHAQENAETRIDVQKQTHGFMRYAVKSSYPTLLVQSGNLRAGWRASLDGERAEILKVNLTAKGVYIPAGEHEVELRYLPASFIRGALISGLSLSLLLLSAGIWAIKKRRSSKP